MTVQPKFHWQFEKRSGTTTVDSLSNVKASLSDAELTGHGRIGNAIHLLKKGSHVNLGKAVGQFGTSDFTVAFGMKNISNHGDGELDIIGSQSMKGHGNFFSLRLSDKRIFFHVDENTKAKHYVKAQTDRLSMVSDRAWFHVAAVRKGRKIKIYIDGVLATEATSKTGVANIKNDTDVKLGHHRRGTPNAQYEDLRIYDVALSANEIKDLLPTGNPRLKAGEVELVATDGAAVVLNKDVKNLHRLSKQFQKLRLGPGTRATLHKKANFEGISQKLYADLPEIRHSKLRDFPTSIQIGSSVGEPFTGGEIIELPSGRVKIADHEGQVGELAVGEVALYENLAYHGKTWVFSDSGTALAGQHPLLDLPGLNDSISSIRLGPETGVTLFKHFNYKVTKGKEENEIESILENVPDLNASQIGNDTLSSIKILRTIEPEDVFTSYTTKLSQDYRMVKGKLEEFSAYRTTLRFEPSATKVEIKVSATDLTQIEVEGKTYEIDEVRSATLSPNALGRIMITSEADGINTPGLKIHTNAMAINERVVIFPNKEAHQQIAELEEGALWNATDAQGNFIVDREAHSKEEVASVQNTIKRVMATVAYADEGPAKLSAKPPGSSPASPSGTAEVGPIAGGPVILNTRSASPKGITRVQSSARVVSAATIDKPWRIEFNPTNNTGHLQSFALTDSNTESPPPRLIQEVQVSKDEWAQLLNRAIPEDTTPGIQARRSGSEGRSRGLFRRIKNAIKAGASAVIGIAEGLVNIIVDTAQGLFRFVVDTVEKAAEFVEAVVDKVVKGIKKFVEFLQFLFNWDDILHTQKFLVKTINSAFDSADSLVTSAKKHVSIFVDDLQETIDEGTDNLIRSLGVDPETVDDDGAELPEAAEWFLDKVFGGSKSSDSQTTPNASSLSTNDSVSDSLQQALENLLEALKDVVGIGLTVFDGLVDTVTQLVANPRRPELALVEILDMLRDVGLKVLDLGEHVALAFLDIVVTAIRLFQDVLNAEIRIPLISDLFKLLGAGKLTILNLLSLLLAIPTTVISKLIFGEKPFQDVETPAFPSPEASESTIDIDSTRRKIRGFGVLAWSADLFNGLIGGGLDIPPESSELDGPLSDFLENLSLGLSCYSWLASFPASRIEPGGYPYNMAHDQHKVSKSANEQAYWQRVMWGWRTAVLGFDIAFTMVSSVNKSDGLDEQRLRRANMATAALSTSLAIVDLGITTRFLLAAPKNQDKKGLRITSQILPMMPNIFCGLRFIEDPVTGIISRAGVAVVAAIPITFNLLLVKDDANSI